MVREGRELEVMSRRAGSSPFWAKQSSGLSRRRRRRHERHPSMANSSHESWLPKACCAWCNRLALAPRPHCYRRRARAMPEQAAKPQSWRLLLSRLPPPSVALHRPTPPHACRLISSPARTRGRLNTQPSRSAACSPQSQTQLPGAGDSFSHPRDECTDRMSLACQDSKPCHNCRRRRLKCDLSLPTCQKCAKTGQECLGYGKLFLWNQGVASRGKMMGRSFAAPPAPPQTSPQRHDRQESRIVARFSGSNAAMSIRNMGMPLQPSLIDPLLQDLSHSSRHYLSHCKDCLVWS